MHLGNPYPPSVSLRVAQTGVRIPACESISSPGGLITSNQVQERFPSRSQFVQRVDCRATMSCATDSAALLRLLRQQTDLPASVLERFEETMSSPLGTRLLGVDLNDTVLTNIGYFID